jgi:hypothetical protein
MNACPGNFGLVFWHASSAMRLLSHIFCMPAAFSTSPAAIVETFFPLLKNAVAHANSFPATAFNVSPMF